MAFDRRASSTTVRKTTKLVRIDGQRIGEDAALPTRIMVAALFALALALPSAAQADERQEACKRAMNDRIQACTDECTKAALAAASNYVDTNNNVKFGCLKGCALRQVVQMQACRDGNKPGADGQTETNR